MLVLLLLHLTQLDKNNGFRSQRLVMRRGHVCLSEFFVQCMVYLYNCRVGCNIVFYNNLATTRPYIVYKLAKINNSVPWPTRIRILCILQDTFLSYWLRLNVSVTEINNMVWCGRPKPAECPMYKMMYQNIMLSHIYFSWSSLWLSPFFFFLLTSTPLCYPGITREWLIRRHFHSMH